MSSVKISEIANESGFKSKEILLKAKELGIQVRSHLSSVTEIEAAAIYDYVRTGVIPNEFAKNNKDNVVNDDNNIVIKDRPKTEEIDNIEEKIEIQVKQEPKKIKEVVVQNDVKDSPSLADLSQKRRGLVIVKRKKDLTPAVSKKVINEQPKISNLQSIFQNESQTKKKKSTKKVVQSHKKDNVQKVDLLADVNFADIVIEDENVVVLPDFSFKNTTKVEPAKPKQVNILKNNLPANTFVNDFSNLGRGRRKKHKKVESKINLNTVSSIEIPSEIRVYEFADKLNKQPSEIISKLFALGMMTTKNDFLDKDAIEILADEFNISVNIVDAHASFDYVSAYEDNLEDLDLNLRAPVITIMGHVDHGKTSLLDYIRNTRVAYGEAGGITQHVGAYMINKNGKNITFIDTPGHEAFSAMRARGASITDIVIVVVAADDGVKPQTKEAISHAKEAGVPIIVAINKMDKESANPEFVKTSLAELGIVPNEWGGEYEFVPISAKTGQGVDELLEIVLLQADILDLKAHDKGKARATIIESSMQKGRGSIATVIVQNGILKVGDTVVAGIAYGKIRNLLDDQGKNLKEIRPGECGVIVGLSEIPESGETLIVVDNDKEAREYAKNKAEYLRQKELSKSTKVSIDELSAKIAEGELKNLPVIVKADVQGSLEAIRVSLEKLNNEEIKVNIIHSAVGGINQNDINLATASENTIILGFNIRPTGDIKEKAKTQGVKIKTYNVIYNLIDDVKAVLSGLMSPVISEEQLGQAQIRQVITIPKLGAIAGCLVTDGNIIRGAKIRLIRNGIVVYEGNISSLKRFKDDVKEVAKGYECGVGIEGYNDLREGDYIESFKEVSQKVSL